MQTRTSFIEQIYWGADLHPLTFLVPQYPVYKGPDVAFRCGLGWENVQKSMYFNLNPHCTDKMRQLLEADRVLGIAPVIPAPPVVVTPTPLPTAVIPSPTAVPTLNPEAKSPSPSNSGQLAPRKYVPPYQQYQKQGPAMVVSGAEEGATGTFLSGGAALPLKQEELPSRHSEWSNNGAYYPSDPVTSKARRLSGTVGTAETAEIYPTYFSSLPPPDASSSSSVPAKRPAPMEIDLTQSDDEEDSSSGRPSTSMAMDVDSGNGAAGRSRRKNAGKRRIDGEEVGTGSGAQPVCFRPSSLTNFSV